MFQNKKYILGGTLVLTSALLLSGCSANVENSQNNKASQEQTQNNEENKSVTKSLSEVAEASLNKAQQDGYTEEVNGMYASYDPSTNRTYFVYPDGLSSYDEGFNPSLTLKSLVEELNAPEGEKYVEFEKTNQGIIYVDSSTDTKITVNDNLITKISFLMMPPTTIDENGNIIEEENTEAVETFINIEYKINDKVKEAMPTAQPAAGGN